MRRCSVDDGIETRGWSGLAPNTLANGGKKRAVSAAFVAVIDCREPLEILARGNSGPFKNRYKW